jgi:hypothetical protein
MPGDLRSLLDHQGCQHTRTLGPEIPLLTDHEELLLLKCERDARLIELVAKFRGSLALLGERAAQNGERCSRLRFAGVVAYDRPPVPRTRG